MSFLVDKLHDLIVPKPNNPNADGQPHNPPAIPAAQSQIHNAPHVQPQQPQPMQHQVAQGPNQAAGSYTETALSILNGAYALYNRLPEGAIPFTIAVGCGSTLIGATPSVLSAASSLVSGGISVASSIVGTGLSLMGADSLGGALYLGSVSALTRWGSPYLGSLKAAGLVYMLPRKVTIAGAMIGYAYPYIADRLSEKWRKLPQPLTNAALTKTDVPAYLAEHIAPLPPVQQQAIATALQILKTNSLLKEDFYGILVAAKNPVGIANTLCLLRNRTNGDLSNKAQYLAIWNGNLEAFKNSTNPLALAKILVMVKDLALAQQALRDPNCPLFRYPADRLARIEAALTNLNPNQIKTIFAISGSALFFSEDPLRMAKILLRLGTRNDLDAATLRSLIKTVCESQSDQLSSIEAALTLFEKKKTPLTPSMLSAIVASKYPLALAHIFIAYDQANLLVTPLLDILKGANASRLKEISLAFENFPSFLKLSTTQRQMLFRAVIESNNPRAFANCITILNKNNISLTEGILNAIYHNTEETNNALMILNDNGKLNNNNVINIVNSNHPRATAEELVLRI